MCVQRFEFNISEAYSQPPESKSMLLINLLKGYTGFESESHDWGSMAPNHHSILTPATTAQMTLRWGLAGATDIGCTRALLPNQTTTTSSTNDGGHVDRDHTMNREREGSFPPCSAEPLRRWVPDEGLTPTPDHLGLVKPPDTIQFNRTALRPFPKGPDCSPARSEPWRRLSHPNCDGGGDWVGWGEHETREVPSA
jgi:hypothetical protein